MQVESRAFQAQEDRRRGHVGAERRREQGLRHCVSHSTVSILIVRIQSTSCGFRFLCFDVMVNLIQACSNLETLNRSIKMNMCRLRFFIRNGIVLAVKNVIYCQLVISKASALYFGIEGIQSA